MSGSTNNPDANALSPDERQKQAYYRDARFTKQYDGIWQTVGKCVFCDLNDKYVFFEENGIVLTIQLYAYIDGHMMIVPRRHIVSAKELTASEWHTIRKCMYIAKKIIKEVHRIGGMQLVQKNGAAAQSTVEHIHFHAIPFDAPDLCVWNYRKLAHTPLENVALYREASSKITALARKFDEKYTDGTHSLAADNLQPSDVLDSAPKDPFRFRWSDIAFGSKKAINDLRAVFIAAPRELSTRRFTQLVKEYLPKGNIVLGIAEEPYVLGFEGQSQFKMLRREDIQRIIEKVHAVSSPHKIYTLTYSQRDTNYLLEKLTFARVLFVNGSWKSTFHTLPVYYTLAQRHVPYELISPFESEQAAHDYEQKIEIEIQNRLAENRLVDRAGDLKGKGRPVDVWSENELMSATAVVASQSYDYSFQTGAVLAQHMTKSNISLAKNSRTYKILATGYNKVVPFQTYAMHYGASRETHFSPPHDLNHYDAVHAEVDLLVHAQKQGIDLHDGTLFVNLLPCPNCARMLCETDISEVVYRIDHSDGYAVGLLERAGKTVRRIVEATGQDKSGKAVY